MAKMMKPEVEAVRFRGGVDVIATSGNPTLTLSGFNDTTEGNGTIVLSNGKDTTSFHPGVTDIIIRSWYSYRPGTSETYDGVGVATASGDSSGFGRLSTSDVSGKPVSWANGVFTYDPSKTNNNYMWFVQ